MEHVEVGQETGWLLEILTGDCVWSGPGDVVEEGEGHKTVWKEERDRETGRWEERARRQG